MRFIYTMIAFLSLIGFQAAHALQSSWVADSEYPFKTRIITTQNNIPQDNIIQAAIEFHLDEKWKIYWRNPGESGLPPSFDFSQSTNLKQVEILWPAPEKLELLGITSIGYQKHVAFPITIITEDPNQPLNINLTNEFLACAHICIPTTAKLKLTLPPQKPGHNIAIDKTADNIRQTYRKQIPQKQNINPQAIDGPLYSHSDKQKHYYRLTARNTADTPGNINVFLENLSGHDNAISPISPMSVAKISPLQGDEILVQFSNSSQSPIAEQLRITVSSRDNNGKLIKAWETTSPVNHDTGVLGATSLAAEGAPNIWLTLMLFSLLGGLILNIMPCVLPALALKAFSVSHREQIDNKATRASFLATAAGIVTCFLIIGGALVTIKIFGGTVGWGIQYQQPAFLSLLFMVMLLFSANLFGLYEVQLPESVNRKLVKFLPATKSHSKTHPKAHPKVHPKVHLGQDFLLGLLATVLATPCSAPFLSTALGVALIVGGMEAMLIFLWLGIGMALPYLAIAAYPKAALLIPKPGRWMIVVKFILGALLLLTAAWLFWLLSLSHSLKIASVVAALGGIAVGYLYLRGKGILAFKSHVALLPSLLLVTAFLLAFSPVDKTNNHAVFGARFGEEESYWQEFDEARISSAVADGKVVFVDVTADWCVTCKFNKFNVLAESRVDAKLNSDGLLALRADWTLPDDEITRYLQKHRRAAVPLNVIYGPAVPQGIVLPEILSTESVLAAIAMAEGAEG